jgi:methylated-DNA-protein-cysteine methyltransferase-like protein
MHLFESLRIVPFQAPLGYTETMAGNESYRRIWEQAVLIPEGQVSSYGQIARLAGLPRRAARMVGRALGAAPEEMNLPWHRVLNAQGRIAIPVESPRYKEQVALLRAEGIKLKNGQLDMDEYRWDPSLDELLWGPGRLHDPAQNEAGAGPQAGAHDKASD